MFEDYINQFKIVEICCLVRRINLIASDEHICNQLLLVFGDICEVLIYGLHGCTMGPTGDCCLGGLVK